MQTKIKWWNPQIGLKEKKFIQQALDNHFPNEGKLTEDFEEKICGLLGCKHAVAVTSATAAMFISLKALGIGHGDEVIVPDVTFIATANAVDLCGAKPILVDVNPKSLTIDAASFSKAITSKTKAVIPVHVSGRAANMKEICSIADNNGLYVVEDAAEAFMSKHHGKYLGTFGKTGCFSFSAHKTITTGQGGIIVTDDHDLCVCLKSLKDQGRPQKGTGGDDIHNTIGYNFKFTDLQAAVGLGQLAYLDQRIERMCSIYKIYKERLKGLKNISVFGFDIENGEVPQWTDVLVNDRDELDQYLRDRGIDCRRYWFPLHSQQAYKLSDDHFPHSTPLMPKALWLPSAYTLTDDDIDTVCNYIKEFVEKNYV